MGGTTALPNILTSQDPHSSSIAMDAGIGVSSGQLRRLLGAGYAGAPASARLDDLPGGRPELCPGGSDLIDGEAAEGGHEEPDRGAQAEIAEFFEAGGHRPSVRESGQTACF